MLKKNVSLKNYTTFKIGGLAQYFFIAQKTEDIISAVKQAKKKKLPLFVLGRGSNVLVSDKGFKGLVIKIQNTKYKIQNTNIMVDAGTPLGQLVNITAKLGLTGLEWAAGIPGTLGGAVSGNAGAFGKSMKDVIEKVEVLDAKDLRVREYGKKQCKFAYRESVFKKKKNLIVLSALLRFKKGKKKEIQKKVKEYFSYKKATQPLNLPSAGSVFKNFTPYRNRVSGAGPEELKIFKKKRVIPAAWLIERAGFKGKRIGGAQISRKHANFIVNFKKAKAEDVKKLIKLVEKGVKKQFGTKLEKEIIIL